MQVVLSNPDYIYLDHPYEPHSEERGKYWATQYTDTRKIFGFMPEDLYKDIAPQELNCTGLQKCDGGRQNVLGENISLAVEAFLRKVKYFLSSLALGDGNAL